MSTTPYSGNSKERLIDLMNSDNNTNLVEGVDFTFGPIAPFAGPNGRNTRIRVIPTDPDQFSEVYVNYTRLSIAVLDLLPDDFIEPVVIESLPFSIHEILPDINAALGLDLTEQEVVDQTFTTAQVDYPLTITGDSHAWVPSTYRFTVAISSTINTEAGDPILTETGFPFQLESAKV